MWAEVPQQDTGGSHKAPLLCPSQAGHLEGGKEKATHTSSARKKVMKSACL